MISRGCNINFVIFVMVKQLKCMDMRTITIIGKDGKTRNLQRISDSVNNANAYYTKQNEYGETQADIDAMLAEFDKCRSKSSGKLTGRFAN